MADNVAFTASSIFPFRLIPPYDLILFSSSFLICVLPVLIVQLCWGCLCFYPFFYCIGIFPLASTENPATATTLQLALSVLTYTCGAFLTRGANMQKYYFKVDPTRAFFGIVPRSLDGKVSRVFPDSSSPHNPPFLMDYFAASFSLLARSLLMAGGELPVTLIIWEKLFKLLVSYQLVLTNTHFKGQPRLLARALTYPGCTHSIT